MATKDFDEPFWIGSDIAKDIFRIIAFDAGGRLVMEDWRRDYNEVRPHSAIGNKPPISLMNGSGSEEPP